jgi:hypothetical protein
LKQYIKKPPQACPARDGIAFENLHPTLLLTNPLIVMTGRRGKNWSKDAVLLLSQYYSQVNLALIKKTGMLQPVFPLLKKITIIEN